MTTIATELAAGIPCTETWRLVAETAPALVATWEAAREACAQHDPAWHRRNHNFQRDRNIPRRRVTSPHGEALKIAEAAVREKFEELLAEGIVTYAGFPVGQLDGNPVAIPLAALGRRRPNVKRISVRGVDYFDVRIYPAETLRGPGRPTGKTRAPRDADDRLRTWLADVDHTDKTIPEITAEIAGAHPEILDLWAASTATKRVAAALPVRSNDFHP